MGKSNTVPISVKVEAAGGDDGAHLAEYPLFAGNAISRRDKLDHVVVQRLGPVPEGQLGKIEPGDSEDVIVRRWGGGKYKLIGKDDRGRPVKGAFETIEIAGEPKFRTRGARLEYRRMLADESIDDDDDGGGKKKRGADFGIEQVLVLLTKQEERARTDGERRQAEAEAAHKREIERVRIEAELRDRERRADDERRERERRAEDERRERDRQEREERDRRLADERQQRDREFYANMLASQKNAQSPVDLLTTGVNLALKLGGSGPADAGEAIAREIPNMIKGGLDVARTMVARGANGANGAPRPAAARPQAAPARPAAAKPAGKEPEPVTLEGDLAAKTKRAVAHLEAQGIDPAAALDAALDMLLAAQRQPAPESSGDAAAAPTARAAEPAPPAAPAEPAPPTAQADGDSAPTAASETSEPKGATT